METPAVGTRVRVKNGWGWLLGEIAAADGGHGWPVVRLDAESRTRKNAPVTDASGCLCFDPKDIQPVETTKRQDARCGNCHRPIYRVGGASAAWYHRHNASVACAPGHGPGGRKAVPR